MLKAIIAGLGIVFAVTLTAAPAGAIKRCPPLAVHYGLPVGKGAACKCGVHNYGTGFDLGVKITMYEATGEIYTCNFDLPPKHGNFCYVAITAGSQCGCMVSGEGATTLVSLSVVDPDTFFAVSSVACQ